MTEEPSFVEAPHLLEGGIAELDIAVAAEHDDALEQPVEARALHGISVL